MKQSDLPDGHSNGVDSSSVKQERAEIELFEFILEVEQDALQGKAVAMQARVKRYLELLDDVQITALNTFYEQIEASPA